MVYNNRGILACEQLLSTYNHHLIKALRIWGNFSSNLYRQMDTDWIWENFLNGVQAVIVCSRQKKITIKSEQVL